LPAAVVAENDVRRSLPACCRQVCDGLTRAASSTTDRPSNRTAVGEEARRNTHAGTVA